MRDAFNRFATLCAKAAGSPWAFALIIVAYVMWGIVGPFVGFSDTWQLWANTATTLATTALVLLVQNTQNRDTAELKAMLRELVRDLPEVDERRARARAEDGDKEG